MSQNRYLCARCIFLRPIRSIPEVRACLKMWTSFLLVRDSRHGYVRCTITNKLSFSCSRVAPTATTYTRPPHNIILLLHVAGHKAAPLFTTTHLSILCNTHTSACHVVRAAE